MILNHQIVSEAQTYYMLFSGWPKLSDINIRIKHTPTLRVRPTQFLDDT